MPESNTIYGQCPQTSVHNRDIRRSLNPRPLVCCVREPCSQEITERRTWSSVALKSPMNTYLRRRTGVDQAHPMNRFHCCQYPSVGDAVCTGNETGSVRPSLNATAVAPGMNDARSNQHHHQPDQQADSPTTNHCHTRCPSFQAPAHTAANRQYQPWFNSVHEKASVVSLHASTSTRSLRTTSTISLRVGTTPKTHCMSSNEHDHPVLADARNRQ